MSFTVQILGVCTHFGPAAGLSIPARHRVVFPSGTLGGFAVHSPTLQIQVGDTTIHSQMLSDVRMSFEGVLSSPKFTGGLGCVPNLPEFFPWYVPDATKVTTAENLDGGAFVDFDYGVISGIEHDCAAASQVVLDGPEPAVLIDPVRPGGVPHRIQVPPLATVVIQSTAPEHRLKDFTLNFLLAQSIPVSQETLDQQLGDAFKAIRHCLGYTPPYEDNVGCSNTQFP